MENFVRVKKNGGIGFRDLQDFNQALLAKHVWRLHSNPESLMARVLKGRYFPNCSVWDSKVGVAPSYSWRSIWGAKKVVEAGVQWRIGDKTSVSIVNDHWIPTPTPRKIMSPLPDFLKESTINALIDSSTATWKVNIIRQFFIPSEADLILSVPLSWRCPCDRRIWHYDRKGLFTVRSAYYVARRMRMLAENQIGESSRSGEEEGAWKFLWSSNIPNKIKFFWWRMLMEILPTRHSLLTRIELRDVSWSFCHDNEETIFHLFCSCPVARQVWFCSPLVIRVDLLPLQSVVAWFNHMHQVLDVQNFEIFLMLGWAIWRARNKMVFSNTPPDPIKIVELALTMQKDFIEAQETSIVPPSDLSNSHGIITWKPPSTEHRMKLNTDATIFSRLCCSGAGMVIRNFKGEVMMAGSRRMEPVTNALFAEAISMRWSLDIALQAGFTEMEIESDSSQLIELLKSKEVNGEIGLIVGDILELLSHLKFFSLAHVRRDGNKVAHALAKLAYNFDEPSIWTEEVPHVVADIVNNDVNGLNQ